ncbi:hypothetical protein BDK89_1459 [Ilumatobacter fluminis]|uniref:Uncharacterized protein n=1 Tax=Ilumatobacter fluminis TaxID=467091 RepID=A0A4R7HYL7_9ACTN|nr:hypothetical protein BDK89_1459 [Ilumatobacter fluminis]
MIDPTALVASLERAVGPLDAADKASLSTKKGASYEAFTLHAVGERLRIGHGWQWHHPPGNSFRFSVRSGCPLDLAMARYSTVRSPEAWLVPSVTVVGKSGWTHDLDIAVLKRGRQSGTPRWTRVRGALECKNEDAQGPGAARDLVGLAAELRLGSQYRLHQSRPFPACQFVTAGTITDTAKGILARWRLDAREGMTSATAGAIAGDIANALVASI